MSYSHLSGYPWHGEGQIMMLRPRVTFSLCSIWDVTRVDGAVKRFCGHNRKLDFDGNEYLPLGASPSDVELRESVGGSDMEILGFLSHESIQPADLHARKYDGAWIRQRIIDYERPWPWAVVRNHRWHIKSVGYSAGLFKAQVHGVENFLTIPAGRRFEIECDATLGGVLCQATPFVLFSAVVDTVASSGSPILGDERERRAFSVTSGSWAGWSPSTPPDNLLVQGSATAIDGPNAGAKILISQHVGMEIVLETDMPFRIAAGDTFKITSGCDKTLTTCDGEYSNLPRHQGHPYLPKSGDLQEKGVEV